MPRRQARGQRRIEQIVDAAADVFAESGYEAATTNAIAAKAGISPGSLYQFFSNKDEVVHALAERYVSELGAALAEAFDPELVASASLEEMIAGVIRPIVDFNLANRGFKALFARTDMPSTLTDAVAPLHAAMLERITSLLAMRSPALSDADVERVAQVSVQIVRAMMPLVVSADEANRERYVAELHAVLAGYLSRALA